MQTIRQLLRKRHSRSVAIWLALVLLGWMIFPPLPIFRIPDGSRVVASSVDGHRIATVGRIRWDDDKLTPGDPDIEDMAAKMHARMGGDRLGNFGPLDLWDLGDTGSRKRLVSSEQRVRDVQFSKTGDLLLALREDKLCVWDTGTGKQLLTQKSGELYSLVEADSEPPMAAMLRQTKPPEYSSASYEGEVDFLALPSGETHTTIGPVQIEPDSMFMLGGKASLRMSRDHKFAVTLKPAAGDKAATQFKQWEISSGKLLATLVVGTPPIWWTISHDGAELIQLTKLVSPNTEQDPSSATGRFPFPRQIEYWEFESGKLRKRLVADESSVTQEVIENCFALRPASDSPILLVDTLFARFLVDTSGDRLDILADGISSHISPDGSLIAAKQGTVFSLPFIGRVNTRSLELKRMPSGEVLRTIEAHPGWPEDEVAFDPLAFSPDQQKLIYVDNTGSGPLAIMMAYWGDLWNGSLWQSDSSRRRRTLCLRSMDISTGRTNVVLRSASVSWWLPTAALSNQYVRVGDRVWRLSGGSPWLHILGLPTGLVVLVLTWKHLRQRRRIRIRKIDSELTS